MRVLATARKSCAEAVEASCWCSALSRESERITGILGLCLLGIFRGLRNSASPRERAGAEAVENIPERSKTAGRPARVRRRPGLRVSRPRRRAAGAAATFAVAAVAAVAGGKLTGSLTPALAVFAGLVAVGVILTYWLSRDDDAALAGGNDQEKEQPGVGPFDLRDARGVQIGDGNVQENYFGQDRDS